MRALVNRLIFWVRHLRQIRSFKVTTRTIVVALMMLGTWVATQTLDFPESVDINDKIIHAVVFFGFAFLMDLSSSRQPFWLWKGLPLLLYGAAIEVLQFFSPERSFSVLDWLADFSGIFLYFLLKSTLIWLFSFRSLNS